MSVAFRECEEWRYLQLQAWPLADSTYISYDLAQFIEKLGYCRSKHIEADEMYTWLTSDG